MFSLVNVNPDQSEGRNNTGLSLLLFMQVLSEFTRV